MLTHTRLPPRSTSQITRLIYPPIVVFHDGTDHWLADGFHRLHAIFMTSEKAIEADVRQGTRRDAILFSVGANASHGLRRTNQDKRRAVETLLRDEEWAAWSDRKIAEACGVSHEFVRQSRPAICQPLTDEAPRKVERNGVTYEMNTAAIGKRPSVEREVGEMAPAFNDAGEPIVRRDDPALISSVWSKPAPASVLASARMPG